MEFKYMIVTASIILIIFISVIIAKGNSEQVALDPITSFYALEATSIFGESAKMDQYKGKKILIVNVASECVYTYQYKSLQKLYEEYQNEVYILAFPS